MGRSRQLQYVRADVYKRSDLEGATDRFPPAEVDRYINQGRAALRDEIIKARGRSYFRKQPAATITTGAGLVSGSTTKYTLPSDFYQLISVRVAEENGDNLEPFTAQDEPDLRYVGASTDWPTHYELQENAIEMLPEHRAGQAVVLEYIPVLTDVSADADLVEGYNGWEDFIVDYAAMQMAMKDDEPRVVAMLDRSLERMRERIQALAPKRDRFRAERTKDVRGSRMFFGRWR